MPDLPGPFEILELRDGESVTLRILDWQLGRSAIRPRDGREPKLIRVLRAFIPAADKPTIPAYWDITSQHLVTALEAALRVGGGAGRRFRITKRGLNAKARFTLETLPP